MFLFYIYISIAVGDPIINTRDGIPLYAVDLTPPHLFYVCPKSGPSAYMSLYFSWKIN